MLFKAIFTNSSGILFSRVLGFVRDLLTASILGANIYSDLFFVAFKLPNLFRRIFGEGAFTQAFIPAFAKSTKKVRFSSVVLLQILSFILILSIFVSLFSHLVIKIIAVGFDPKLLDLGAPLVAITFYYLPLIFLVSFFSALLQYKNHFATTAYSTALLNLALIGALLLARHKDSCIIATYLSYGVVVGGFLQVLAHLYSIKRFGLLKLFSLKDLSVKYTKKFYHTFLQASIGSSTAHISSFIDTWLASFLISGSISHLYYGNRIFQLPLALFAIATSIALFPMVAKAIKKNKTEEALRLMRKSFWILFFVLGFATLIGIIFSHQIIFLLFQRGSFTPSDTLHTQTILSMYLVGLLPFGLSKIFLLWLYSLQEQKKAAKISIIALTWNIIFSLALIIPYKATGLALASSLSGFVLFFLTVKEFGFKSFWKLLKFSYNKSSRG